MDSGMVLLRGARIGREIENLFVVNYSQPNAIQPSATAEDIFSNRGVGEEIDGCVDFEPEGRQR